MTFPGTDTLATYGGLLSDYAAVEDPQTDRPASGANQAYASTAAMTHCVPRAYVVIVGNATTPTVAEHDAAWGNTAGVLPTLVRNSAGDITVAWPATVTDELGTVGVAVNLKRCAGWNIEGTVPGFVTVTPVTANTMRVRLFSAAGASTDFVGVNVTVYVR